MPHIEYYDCCCAAISRRFQNHVISRVSQIGSSPKGQADRFGDRNEVIQHHLNFRRLYLTRCQMFRSLQDGFVFQQERHGKQYFESMIQSRQQHLARRAQTAAKRGDHYARVEYPDPPHVS
jgi:hypothetical protein